MIDKEKPPPPSGESNESGEWDNGGVAPRWRKLTRTEKYAPYTHAVVVAFIGVFLGSIGTIITGSYLASRSESFQWEQEQRERIDVVVPEIHEMLDIVKEQDTDKLEKALRRLGNSTTYLSAYRDLLRPLNMAFLGMRTDLSHYQIQSIDPETNVRTIDESEIENIESVGWEKIRWEALRMESKLRLSKDPYTLECISELCGLAL